MERRRKNLIPLSIHGLLVMEFLKISRRFYIRNMNFAMLIIFLVISVIFRKKSL